MFDFKFEEQAFALESARRQGGTAPSMGRFIDPKTNEFWLGKSEIGESEEASKILACREKLANDIYGIYGVKVARIRISRQSLVIEDPAARSLFESNGRTHAWHIMSRWLDRFEIYGEHFAIKPGLKHYLIVEERLLPEKGLGAILAVAHWINDIDVIGPSGKNVGYQLQLDSDQKLFALSCKIDPGNSFHDFNKSSADNVTFKIQVGMNGGKVIDFYDLPTRTQKEYLKTIHAIISTPEGVIREWFIDKYLSCLEGNVAKKRSDYLPLSTYIERLLKRRANLAKLHQPSLKNLKIKKPPTINHAVLVPDYLQKLYCRAKLAYQSVAADLDDTYIPLDVVSKPSSTNTIPLKQCLDDVINSQTYQALLLLGASGAGKTLATFALVEQLWQKFIADPTKQSYIPIRIELRQFTQRTVGQCIINTLFDDFQYSLADLKKLQKHKFCFIFEGADELSGNLNVNLIQKSHVHDGNYGAWNAKYITTCRDYFYYDLEPSLFYPANGVAGLRIEYLNFLTKEQQIEYLTKHKQKYPRKKFPDYQIIFRANSHLHEIIDTPFALKIFRDALLQWQENHKNQPIGKLTRYDLYGAFLDYWFKSEDMRLCMTKAKWLNGLPQKFVEFSTKLALLMFEQDVDVIHLKPEDNKNIVAQFFSTQDESLLQARSACPLRYGRNQFSFIHKSFLEYFVARAFWEALLSGVMNVWNVRYIAKFPEIIQFLLEAFKNLEREKRDFIKNRLFEYIHAADKDAKWKILSSNAATVFNSLGYNFTRKYGNLQNVKIPNADLTGAIVDGNCKNASFENVKLKYSLIRNTDFGECNLEGVIFEGFPDMKGNQIIFSPDNILSAILKGDSSSNKIEIIEFGNANQEGKYLVGHTEKVILAVFNSDGKILATASRDKTIRLWDLVILKIMGNPININNEYSTKLIFGPKGNFLISSDDSNNIQIWDVITQKLIGHPEKCYPNEKVSFDLSSDGQRIVIISGGQVLVWDIISQQYLSKISSIEPQTRLLFFGATHSNNGELVSLRVRDYNVSGQKNVLWDVNKQKVISTSYVSREIFSADGTDLAQSGHSCIYLIDLKTMIKRTVQVALGEADPITFSHDKKMLAVKIEGKTIQLVDVNEGKLVGESILIPNGFKSVVFSHDSKILAIVNHDDVISFLQVDLLLEKFEKQKEHKPDSQIFSLDFDEKGEVVLCRDKESVYSWDLKDFISKKLSSSFPSQESNMVRCNNNKIVACNTRTCWLDLTTDSYFSYPERLTNRCVTVVALSADGHCLAIGIKDGGVELWDVQKQTDIAEIFPRSENTDNWNKIKKLKFSLDGKVLAVILEENIKLIDVATRKLLSQEVKNTDSEYVDISCDGKKILIIKKHSNNLQVYKLRNDQFYLLFSLEMTTDLLVSVGFCLDNRFLAIVRNPYSLSLLNLEGDPTLKVIIENRQLKEERKLYLFQSKNYQLVFSKDMKYLATKYGNDIVVNNLMTTKYTLLKGHYAAVTCLAFNSQGQLVSGGDDRTVLLWEHTGNDQWSVIARLSSYPRLSASGAKFCGARLDRKNAKLLSQQGADTTQAKISQTENYPSFWQRASVDNPNLQAPVPFLSLVPL